jgi:hypothetical protein
MASRLGAIASAATTIRATVSRVNANARRSEAFDGAVCSRKSIETRPLKSGVGG